MTGFISAYKVYSDVYAPIYSVIYIIIVSLASVTAGDSHVFVIMYELFTMRDG